MFDRTVDAKGIKTEDLKETVTAFLTRTAETNGP